MGEIISTYRLDDLEKAIPMDRDLFYKEQVGTSRDTGKPTKANEVASIFIFNFRGEMLVQKRSYGKAHNPGLLDKSVGGHVQYGDTVDYTVMVETVQELQTSSIVLKDDRDFAKTYDLLSDYLTTIAVVKHIKTQVYEMEKVFDGRPVKIVSKIHVFFGIYGGNIKPADREAQGVLFYTLEEIEKEMERSPETFTGDMKVFMEDLAGEMREFLKETTGR